MTYRSLAELFLSQAGRYGDRVLYRFFRDGRWQAYTWLEVLRQVREIGLGLLSLGVEKGDRVGIFSANRVEWSLIDWANICIGALTVPVYSSSTPSQVAHILDHSGSMVLFVEYPERLWKVGPDRDEVRQLKKIIVIESDSLRLGEPERIVTLDQLRELGRRYAEDHKGRFEEIAYSLRPEDDLTIIYTSGTTGEPKGVLTTHGHYLFMIDAVDSAIPSAGGDVNLQFLPLAHSFGRLEHFMVVAKAYTCGFARSIDTISRDLLVIRPTVLFSVPRIYENAYNRIQARIAAARFPSRLLFRLGLSTGRKFSRYQREGRRIPLTLRLARSVAQRLVFSKIQASFGGRLRLAISGGAALAPEIAEFFHALGILILEGYGLTESSTVSHVNRLGRYKFGTVGPPLKGVECKVAPDGEILLRGPNIFKGYYRDPEATAEAVESDGWFHTGDIGQIDEEGFLTITDRKKDLIVTSGGKKIAPQMVENLLKTDPLISQVMVIGDGQPHLMALITLNREELFQWAKRAGLKFESPEELLSHPSVSSLVRERIRQKNRQLAPYEAVRSFRILPEEFSVERGELTPSLKLRRQKVVDRYRDLIEEMYHRARFDV